MADLSTFGIYQGEGRYHEEIIYSTALIYNIISNDISKYIKKYNLTIGKLNILIAIQHHCAKEGIPQVEISKHLIVTASNMTKMIDKLEEEELVSRSALKGDRRVNIVKITKKGSKLLDSVWEGYNEKLIDAVSCLSKEKQKQLAGLLLEWFEKVK